MESFVHVARDHGLSTWKIDYRVSGLATDPGPLPKTPPDGQNTEKYNESLYTVLENVLDSSEDLDDQIKSLKVCLFTISFLFV